MVCVPTISTLIYNTAFFAANKSTCKRNCPPFLANVTNKQQSDFDTTEGFCFHKGVLFESRRPTQV